MNPTDHIFYKTWKDKGGNVGVQCTDCEQTFWTGKETIGKVPVDPMDMTKGLKACPNCQAMIELQVLKNETNRHQNESEENCSHYPSQP